MELALLQVSGFIPRSRGSLVVLEIEPAHLSSGRTLDLKVRGNVPCHGTMKTEKVLHGQVGVLVHVPVRIDIVRVHSVPVRIFAVLVLVCPKPLLVVCRGESHQVLSYIRLAVSQSRTVLHVLAGIVRREVKVHLAYRGIGPEIEHIPAHIRLRNNIPVAHIRHRKTYSGISGVRRHGNGIVRCQTCPEKT